MDERLFTVGEAQRLLDSDLRGLAERMVELRAEWVPLQERWRKVVLAVGSNGGGIARRDTERLRERLERLTEELNGVIEQITGHDVQVKDMDRGLLDFPALVDGEPALLCWCVGEAQIAFWHSHEDGFAGRKPLPPP